MNTNRERWSENLLEATMDIGCIIVVVAFFAAFVFKMLQEAWQSLVITP